MVGFCYEKQNAVGAFQKATFPLRHISKWLIFPSPWATQREISEVCAAGPRAAPGGKIPEAGVPPTLRLRGDSQEFLTEASPQPAPSDSSVTL